MAVKLRPVCDCGYVFYKFECKNTYITINSKVKVRNPEISPKSCPRCGSEVDKLLCKYVVGSEDFDFNY